LARRLGHRIQLRHAETAHMTPDDAEHLNLLTAYGIQDAVVQGRVLPSLLASIRRHGTAKGFEDDCRLNPTIRDMGLLGLPQSIERADAMRSKVEARRIEVVKRAREIADRPDLNLGSSPQVADWLFGTRGLRPVLNAEGDAWEEDDGWSVSRDCLLALEESGVPEDVARFINLKIQFGSLSTLLSKDIARVYAERPHPAFHESATWLQPSFRKETTTGRLVSNPNVQNYTTRGFVNTRSLFVAPPGHVFVIADSEQLELRLYAAESGDEYYTRAFVEGLDAHSLNVVSLLAPEGSSEGDVMRLYADFMRKLNGGDTDAKKVRTLYKSVVFGMLYGAGWERVWKILAWSVNKATGERLFPDLMGAKGRKLIREVYERFKRVHPWLERWHARVDRHVSTHGWIEESAGGRRVVYPEGPSEPNAPRNFTIQAAAATHIDRTMEQIADAYPYQSLSEWTGLTNQVHDEIVLCVPESEAPRACGIVTEAFRRDHKGIPLLGEAEVFTAYADPTTRRKDLESP